VFFTVALLVGVAGIVVARVHGDREGGAPLVVFALLLVGVVTLDAKGDVDVGRWHITDDGQYCRTWNVGDRGRLRCYRVYRDGEAFELHAVDRWTVTKLRRQP
jgi:hypothetical protein